MNRLSCSADRNFVVWVRKNWGAAPTKTEAVKEIESQLAKGPRRGAKTETEGSAGGDGESDDADTEGDDAAVEDEAA